MFFTFLHTKIPFADILGGNRTHLNGIVPAWEHPSVSLKNYTELFGYARSYWTNNGSKLYGFSLYSNTTPTSNIDEHYVEQGDRAGVFGEVVPIGRTDNYTYRTGNDDNWAFCRLYIYDNQMNNYGLDYEEKLHTVTHELGHTLKLHHPSGLVNSVMNSTKGALNPWDCQQNKIYQYDKDELIRKWGKK